MQKRVTLFDDGVARQEAVLQPSENRLYVHTTQPNKRRILEANRKDANNSRAHRDLRLVLRIPEDDFKGICAKYPDLIRGNQEDALRAVELIAKAHPEYVRVEPQQRIFPSARKTM